MLCVVLKSLCAILHMHQVRILEGTSWFCAGHFELV